jgi:ABC-type multidrug transport system permease subunit
LDLDRIGSGRQSGLLFFIGVFWGYFPLFTAIFTFPIERSIMAKERAADMYRVSAYFMARTLSDLPIELALTLLFILILYFMANLRRTFTAFCFTVAAVCLDVITSQVKIDYLRIC